MAKRMLAALLWFYAGWYAGGVLATILGISELLGPILGTAAAAIFAGDPRQLIWSRGSRRIGRATPEPGARPG